MPRSSRPPVLIPVVCVLSVAVAACFGFTAVARAGQTRQYAPSIGLHIVVIAGEDAVNVIQQKTAVAPVVEVRDRNNQPVAGAAVTFLIGGNRATFANGLKTLTMTTDGGGRALMSGLNPVGRGAVQISVRATFQGQVATAAITQTNVLTAAAASGTAGGGAAGGGGVAAGAVAGGAAAAGGLSATAIAGIVGGVGAGAAATVVAVHASSESSSSSPTISVSPSGTGIQSVTVYAFTAKGGAAAATYAWDFGDGGTAAGQSATHQYGTSGTFQVTLTATTTDGAQQQSVKAVTVGNLNGTWVFPNTSPCDPVTGGAVTREQLNVVQQGSSLSGQWIIVYNSACPGTANTSPNVSALSGSVSSPRGIAISEAGECQRTVTSGTVDATLSTIQGPGVLVNSNPSCYHGPYSVNFVRQ